jgi:hypothetical protein
VTHHEATAGNVTGHPRGRPRGSGRGQAQTNNANQRGRGRRDAAENAGTVRGRTGRQRGRGRGPTPARQAATNEDPNWNSFDEDYPEDITVEFDAEALLNYGPAPIGWIPPPITPRLRSPILLRHHGEGALVATPPSSEQFSYLDELYTAYEARREGLHTALQGTYEQHPILVGEESTGGLEEGIVKADSTCEIDSDCEMLDGGSFHTPPPSQAADSVSIIGMRRTRSAICKFTIEDFTPGALAPNPYLRQSVGEYLPWLHNYGKSTCPFTVPAFEWQ